MLYKTLLSIYCKKLYKARNLINLMQKKRVMVLIRFLLILVLLIISVSVVSGISMREFFEKTSTGIISITGRPTSQVTSLNLTLSGTNPTIYFVYNTSVQTITDNSFTNITISFAVNDPDGVDDVAFARARVNLTRNVSAGSPVFNYSSSTSGGCFDSGDINSTVANISCSVHVWYFLPGGEWNISVGYIEANGSFAAQNTTHNLTISSTTAIQISPTNITFGSPSPGTDNASSNNDPVVVNNTGNVGAASGNVRITGLNLIGETTKTQYIPAVNFSAEIVNSTTADANAGCTNGNNATALTNATAAGISNSVLAVGNHSINNGTSGLEHIFVCIEDVPLGLSVQSYSTLELGAWTVDVV